jgi:hypothetical protein
MTVGSAAVATPSPGSCQSSQGTLPNEVRFELGQRAEKVEDQAPGGAGGVDPLVEAAEADAPLLEGGDDVDELPHGSGQAVESPSDQGVARSEVVGPPPP